MTGSVETLYPIVRGLLFVALLLSIGTQVAKGLVARHLTGRDAAVDAATAGWFDRLPGLLAWFLLMLVMARGALQLLSFADPGVPVPGELVRAVLLDSPWGAAWSTQCVATFLLLATSWLWRAHPGRLRWSGFLFLGAILWAQGRMGHGSEELWPPTVGPLVHAVHLLGGGLWLGTLGVLAMTTFPALRGPDRLPLLADLVRAFSGPARIGAVLLVLSGSAATLVYGGPILQLPSTPWGAMLLRKLIVLTGVLALGWWNWKVVTPGLEAGTPAAPARLRRAVAVELLLGAILLALTAWLVAEPLPGTS